MESIFSTQNLQTFLRRKNLRPPSRPPEPPGPPRESRRGPRSGRSCPPVAEVAVGVSDMFLLQKAASCSLPAASLNFVYPNFAYQLRTTTFPTGSWFTPSLLERVRLPALPQVQP